jgi:hypothetical protein
MNFVKATLVVAALGLVTAATAANAATANAGSCSKAERAVQTAIDANASSASLDAAKNERRLGTSFCQYSQYDKGMDHLNKALSLLGATTVASN